MVRIYFDESDERRTAQDLFDGPFDVRHIRQKGTQNRFQKVKLPMRRFAKRVLSPELQECMETNERSAATGAPDREPQITPERLKAQ